MDPLDRRKVHLRTYVVVALSAHSAAAVRVALLPRVDSTVGPGTIARQCSAPNSAQATELPSATRAVAASRGTNGAVCTYLRAVCTWN